MKKVVFTSFLLLTLWISIVIINHITSFTSYRTSDLLQDSDNYKVPLNFRNVENTPRYKGKLLCLIFTYPKNINKTLSVQKTWAKRCDKQLYFSNKTLPNIPTTVLNVTESRQTLGMKTRLAFQYVYDHYIDEYDWFLKADDDCYIIVENLRKLLSDYDSNNTLYFGRKFSKFKGTTFYMSGGAGYVLSKASVKILAEECFHEMKHYFKSIEDMAVGTCAEKHNFTAPDTRDSLGRERFHSFPPVFYFDKRNAPEWVAWYSVNQLKWGIENLSDKTISFHYLTPTEIQLLEFYLYKVNTGRRLNEESHQ